ncbi:HD-domain/PDEase-like protein [Cryphonectria parasitica EP155]|uniref:Phosphodiesterase n=1 Tax=Cryphonectria parasitica (strain ATCC 38755 / EP155) TaxID=660469 RepID=A0A9P4YAC6_CRYP1|nr:HD-domain/PDEase-like protein [Cryphonectria parasitica EP155]KAF3769959.1 HD-domain/PDEase-like protein [Cryphonectria parasitica EP155]
MDRTDINVIYVHRQAHEGHPVDIGLVDGLAIHNTHAAEPGYLRDSIQLLNETFGQVHVCPSSTSCLSTLSALHHASRIDHTPTIVLLDVPYNERVPERPQRPSSRSRSPSPHSNPSPLPPVRHDELQISDVELYGLRLLQRIVAEADMLKLMKLIVPIAVISPPTKLQVGPLLGSGTADDGAVTSFSAGYSSRPDLVRTCLDYGAVDVMSMPLRPQNIENLEVHAYKARQAAAREREAVLQVRKNRKRSWVGVDTGGKPFAYLREAMVSGLMRGICRLDDDDEDNSLGTFRISISTERQAEIAEAVGRWHFCAHDFSDDELVVAASLMFSHALSMPELAQWRIPPDQLTQFVIACRAAYNSFVPYHNFRHVVDVLQATFSFLLHTNTITPYPFSEPQDDQPKSPVGALLMPFEALTLLITAIGHDVGHPGVNNGFLVTLNAPLAQLYNDRSVLESFHCAAFSQILRRYWPSAFEDRKMRGLMISSILATDMGLHFDYMKRLADLKEKLSANDSTEGWNSRMIDEQKGLACALLIKCADISNVARRHETALQWMDILADEFARQRSMEKELEIPTSLMAPPLTERASQFRSQLNFMNMFALPLFQGVADILPSMRYTVSELTANSEMFLQKVAEALTKQQTERSHQQGGPEVALETNASAQTSDPIPRSASTPELRGGHKGANGISSPFEPVNEDRSAGSDRQRSSQTTQGSSVAQTTGDCASSATTGRLPLSPSTQGTSVVSQESIERPRSNPIPTICAPDSAKSMTEPKMDGQPIFEVETASSANSAHEKSIKKRPSRFRMNAFQFFRRHKSYETATESP